MSVLTERLGGKPVELYTFQRNTEVWRYTSHGAPVVVAGFTFLPAAIRRGDLKRDNDTGATRVTVEVGGKTPIAPLLLQPHPAPVALTIQRTHLTALADPPLLLVSGSVRQVASKGSIVEASVETIEAAFAQGAPRVLVTRDCQNMVYDWRCGLIRAEWEQACSVLAFDPATRTLNLSNLGGAKKVVGGAITTVFVTDGFWVGAALRTADRTYLYVHEHAGDLVRVMGPLPPALATGQTLYIAPPCPKNVKACRDYFNNTHNFLGFPFLPTVNPFVDGME